MKTRSVPAAMVVLALVGSACGKSKSPTSGSSLPTKIGAGEGALNLIAWPGYVESGQNSPTADWVTPFQTQTGCKVSVKYGNTSDEMVNLMRQGGGTQYDGVSASGDATNRLIAHGDVAEINVKLIPSFGQMMPSLQSPPHNTVDGRHYGVPYMWGPNFLMYNTDVVTTPPLRREGHGLRQPDLHRRRGPVPEGAQPVARDQGRL